MIVTLIYHNAVQEFLRFTALAKRFESRNPWSEITIANSNKDTANDTEAQPEDKKCGKSN